MKVSVQNTNKRKKPKVIKMEDVKKCSTCDNRVEIRGSDEYCCIWADALLVTNDEPTKCKGWTPKEAKPTKVIKNGRT
jgi:hypothetical protein